MPNDKKFTFFQQLFIVISIAIPVWDICFGKGLYNLFHLLLTILISIIIFDKSTIKSLKEIIKSYKGNNKNNHTKETIKETIVILPFIKEYYDPDEEKLSYDKKYSSDIKDSKTVKNLIK